MLDLTTYNNNYYEIRLLDKTELHLKRPTQAMIQTIINMQGLIEQEKNVETILELANLFARVLNRNIEGKTYKAQELAEEYDFDVVGYVINDYFNYWQKEVDEKVNFQESQQ